MIGGVLRAVDELSEGDEGRCELDMNLSSGSQLTERLKFGINVGAYFEFSALVVVILLRIRSLSGDLYLLCCEISQISKMYSFNKLVAILVTPKAQARPPDILRHYIRRTCWCGTVAVMVMRPAGVVQSIA